MILLCLPLVGFGIDPGMLEGKWLTIGTTRSNTHLFEFKNGKVLRELYWGISNETYSVDDSFITFKPTKGTDTVVYEIMNLTIDSLTLLALNQNARSEWRTMNYGIYRKPYILKLYRLRTLEFEFDSIVLETRSEAIPYQTYYSPAVQISIAISKSGYVRYHREVFDTVSYESKKTRINFGISCSDKEIICQQLSKNETSDFLQKIYSSSILQLNMERDFRGGIHGGFHTSKKKVVLFQSGKSVKEIETWKYPLAIEPLVNFIVGIHNNLKHPK